MPIAGRNLQKTVSWGTPRIDMGGCVLYAPLWRPDMVARGGSVVSGTGTMAVTPLNLAVGANTVTSLTAGTFTITIPQGGTCASNGATIIGSTVTIPAGVATTVDTGVTTGTFTVTPSNIIRSRDKNNRALTVIDDLWTPQGRDFDGLDDYITTPNLFSGTGDITIEVWVKTISLVADQYVVFIGTAGASQGIVCEVAVGYFALAIYGSATLKSNSLVTDGAFHHCVATVYGGSHERIYVDRVLQTATRDDAYDIVAAAVNYISSYGGAVPVDGIIGEVRVYARALSVGEIQQNYLATKWRYQ